MKTAQTCQSTTFQQQLQCCSAAVLCPVKCLLPFPPKLPFHRILSSLRFRFVTPDMSKVSPTSLSLSTSKVVSASTPFRTPKSVRKKGKEQSDQRILGVFRFASERLGNFLVVVVYKIYFCRLILNNILPLLYLLQEGSPDLQACLMRQPLVV